jgi:6-pyruvoyl-tetrahydropterin synthase
MARQKMLKEADAQIITDIKKELKDAEVMNEKFKKLFFEQTLKILKNQATVYAAYLKLLI